jgi:pimeloyl-ACP methyl ester carboxylesterase
VIERHDLTVDGIRIHFAEAGKGPALLLLHGVSGTHRIWSHTIGAFSDRWRVIAPDLPGHGGSAKPDAPYTIDFHAGMIRSLGRELGLDEVVVVGNSLGGLIALEIACAYRRWTRGLVLAAPAGGLPPALRPVGWVVRALAGPRVLRIALERMVSRAFYDPTSAACAERRRLMMEQLADDDYPSFARAVSRSVAGAIMASEPPLSELTQPVLLVWGRQDRTVGLARSQQIMRHVRHARLTVFDRCGHLPMLECPDAFNTELAEFLRAVEAAPRVPVAARGG